ncbi:MAG: NAD(P)-binding domain-containing protein [Clostridiales bacterium]|nr:NAD(P)-binding domain-containing protein [Clostridiales bacterium]
MKIGIIGYGSMGKMLLWKFSEAGKISKEDLFVANRTPEKLEETKQIANVSDNAGAAGASDILFLCVRPSDLKGVLEEIRDHVKPDALVVSLNGSVTFESLHKVIGGKLAKVIPSLTAEIGRSQTLVCYDSGVSAQDKQTLESLLKCIGNVIELPENEMGMGSELVSCMPGFIASIFDVICTSAEGHTSIPKEQIVSMVLSTMSATGDLMIQKDMTFENVVSRVATKGGITEEGTKVVYEGFPETADLLFEKTLEKRKLTSEKANNDFAK